MGKIILLVFVLLLFSSVVIAVPVDIVAAEGTIYIRADGSVDGTAAIRRDGNVYTFTGNVYGSIVVEKDNVVVDGAAYTLQGTGNGIGIIMVGRSNITIKNVEIKEFITGLSLRSSSNNTISGNAITANNGAGIILFHSSNNNTISGNNIIANNKSGISIDVDSSNSIIGNYIVNNMRGIVFGGSSNIVIGNYIANNKEGLYFQGLVPVAGASNNTIHHNSFINNAKQINDYHWTSSFSKPSINVWDDGAAGNYWSDYVIKYPNAKEVDGSGIWDTPYVIDENNKDNYPLMNNLILPLETTPPFISVVSPENKSYGTSNVSLTFTVSEPTLWMGYSLDGQDNVTVAGNSTLTGLPDGTHSLTVYAMDVFENTGASEPVYFTVDTVPPTVTLLSPQNKTYGTTDVPLTFTVNEPLLHFSYSLDKQENVTITGNTTLTGLSNGSHNVTVYAWDNAGNIGTSETIYFSISKPALFPTTWIIAVAAAAVVSASLIFYFKKRKRSRENKNIFHKKGQVRHILSSAYEKRNFDTNTHIRTLSFNGSWGQFVILASANPTMILPDNIIVKIEGGVDPPTDLIKQVGIDRASKVRFLLNSSFLLS